MTTLIHPLASTQPSSSTGSGAALTTSGATPSSASGSNALEDTQLNDEDDDAEEDAEESDEDDEEYGSDVSDGGDLQSELQAALDDTNFSFTGTFYHASLLTTSPNPCLQISGLGIVGLPLSERDAKSIISCATLAPFGHGERTVVDKSVRDTWEIEPARVTFINPQWEAYVKSTVISEVCKSLGVKIGRNPPRLELYKLLLYEQGSHFLPHQDTQKANGMFATVIIILPSAYTGGQVVVSHASTTQTLDFSANSLLSTALLAWYTDVKHEVKEITSGFRLALSYNLIHDSASGHDPCPGLPEMDGAVVGLRRVLRKWKANKYDSDRNLIAYVLKHEYSSINLDDGVQGLKGVDAHRVTFLRTVAEELGFMVGLGTLVHNLTGAADDDGRDYYRRGRYDFDDYGGGRERTPGMLEVYERSTTIADLVDLDGDSLISVGEIDVGVKELIPKNPFKNAKPDETEYEGYMGNGAGSLEYWYRRTVLVIMPENRVDDICFEVEGISYAYEKLKESTAIPPTQVDRQWASRLMDKDGSLTKEYIVTLMDYALKWQDLAMWKKTMKLRSCSLQFVSVPNLLKAWKQFSFDEVRVSFEEILARSTELPERIEFLFQVKAQVVSRDNDAILSWYQKELQKILSGYNKAAVTDVPTLVHIIRNVGLDLFRASIMPNLLKGQGNYEFWLAFFKALQGSRHVIVAQEAQRHQQANPAAGADVPAMSGAQVQAPAQVGDQRVEALDGLIKETLQAAALGWAGVPTNQYYHSYYRNPATLKSKVDRILELVEAGLTISNLDICRNLFADMIKSNDQSKSKFDDVYIPLVPRLRDLLTKKQIALSSSPFVDLCQVLIGIYLRDILGKKHHQRAPLRKIGCGCQDCNGLDRFILDPKMPSVQFRLVQARRTHLEHRLLNARDICTSTTIRSGSPHALHVAKLPDIVQAAAWPGKQQAAKTFLASFGGDAVVAQIMGSRFQEVQQAVAGITPFGSARSTISSAPTASGPSARPAQPASTATSSNAQPPAVATTSLHPPPARAGPPQVAGTKRKNIVQLGPVIDLTEDD